MPILTGFLGRGQTVSLSRPGDIASLSRPGDIAGLSRPGDIASLSRPGDNTSPPHRKQSRFLSPTSQSSLSRSGDNASLHWSCLPIGSLPSGTEFFCTDVVTSLIPVAFPRTQFSSHLVSPNVPNIALSTNVWKRLPCTLLISHQKLFHWAMLIRTVK